MLHKHFHMKLFLNPFWEGNIKSLCFCIRHAHFLNLAFNMLLRKNNCYLFGKWVSLRMQWAVCLCPQNSHVETLIPSVMIFGDWEVIRYESGALVMGLVCLSVSCEDVAGRQMSRRSQERGCSQISNFSISRNVRNACLFSKPLSLWYFCYRSPNWLRQGIFSVRCSHSSKALLHTVHFLKHQKVY